MAPCAKSSSHLRSAVSKRGSSLVFEFTIGRAVGTSWMQLLDDYNPARGGLMVFGLAFMFVTPMLIARPHSRETLK